MKLLLEQHGIAAVYHWTPIESVASILAQGILSRSTLDYRRIPHAAHRYGSADKEQFLRNYVALSFRPKPLMMDQQCENPAVLEVDAGVLTKPGTLFVLGNSATRTTSVDAIRACEGAGALDALFGPRGLRGECEAWVPWSVPAPAIRTVHVRGEETRALLCDAFKAAGHPHPPVLVSTTMFAAPGTADLYELIRRSSESDELPF